MDILLVDNHKIKITHPDKIIFPAEQITKYDLILYYKKVTSFILPFLKDRPLTIQRFPEGIDHPGFFQQHASFHLPTWFKTIELEKKAGGTMKHLLCQNAASLVYLAEQGMITPHRWLSCMQYADLPDILIIDIDPPISKFKLACKGAKLIKDFLARDGLTAFVMTTGSKGLHVVVPIRPKLHFDACRLFIKKKMQQLIEYYPNEFTIETRKEERLERVYLDVMRNTYGHTAVAPYAVRALSVAPIAVPLTWDELDDPQLSAQKYTLKNIDQRLQVTPHPWKNFM